jgi:DNA-binding transcriptional MerR regulator/effector-binding domain-containing protein
MSIGTFAGIAQVSVRMLRHWDAVGLLTPAHVDEWSGYRSYSAAQLTRLNRIVALRDLGFGLDDVRTMLADGVTTERLEELLRTRRRRVETEHAVAVTRLAEVARRLQEIQESTMSSIEIVTKSLPALRLAARRAHFPDGAVQGDVVEGMFVGVAEAIGHRSGALETPVAEYTWDDDGDLDVVAGYAYGGEPDERFEIVELPAVERAACAVHLGEMVRVRQTWGALMTGIEERGLRPAGPGRELYVETMPDDDQSGWVTELQMPVRPA